MIITILSCNNVHPSILHNFCKRIFTLDASFAFVAIIGTQRPRVVSDNVWPKDSQKEACFHFNQTTSQNDQNQ